MKKYILFLLTITFTSCAVQKNSPDYDPEKHTYLDETGKEVSENEFWKIRLNSEEEITRWNYIAVDTGEVSKIVKPVYSTYLVDYPTFKKKIEKITGRRFDDKIFLLEYKYFKDLCSGNGTSYKKVAIHHRKKFTSPNKKEIENRNKDVVVLNLFEEGIVLANSPDSPKEYFFKDKGNFFRNAIFRTQALCGSFALIKPNGEVLVRNGESTAEFMEEHINPQNWNIFFPEEE